MKIFKKQIPVRHILYVVLGWLHATMLCVPLYALVLNFVSEGMTKDVILQNILRGFLILAPIALSWFAIKCLRRIFFYILASIGITVLTGFLFDSVLMAVVALFICFMRLYGRLHGESYSLFDHAGYAGLAVFAVPLLCSVFTDRADLIFQPVSLVFTAVYFVLCLTQRGIRRIDDYIDVNAAMQNMPARRIVRITCALLAAAAVFCAAVLLPPLLTSDIGYRYTPREAIHAEYTPPEQTEASSGGDMPLDEMIPAAEPSPVLVLIMKILEYIVLIALAGGLIFGVIYGCIRISRGFKTSFVDRRDLVENLPEDERTTVRERAQKRHNNEIAALTGRNIVCGSTSYVYFHGLDYTERETDMQSMFSAPQANCALFEKYSIDYILVSAYERNNFTVNEAEIKALFPCVFDENGVQIYKVTF